MSSPHPHGAFGWSDLATEDVDAAKAFYATLFGWTFEDVDAGEAGTYTYCLLDGAHVAGLYRLAPEQKQQGMTPCWSVYAAVDDVDDACAEVAAAGGSVLMPPFDIPDTGRMAVIQDPQGGVLSLWQRNSPHTGYTHIDGRSGTMCWHELATGDPDDAERFYAPLMGWTAEAMPGGPDYTVFLSDGIARGGMLPTAAIGESVPTHWMPYVAVDDCDAIAAATVAHGGRVLRAPSDIEGVGRFAVIADPQDAVIAVIRLIEPAEAPPGS